MIDPSIRILTVTGNSIQEYLPLLAQLRIQVFRDFPYLYDGSTDYEQTYLQIYLKSSETIFVLVFDRDDVVGASSGMPLQLETDEVKYPFIKNGFPVEEVFYFGESVLLKSYRGQGIGKVFFQKREAHAQSLGYTFTSFCGVIRPKNHPLKPAGYKPLDDFWKKQGYEKKQGMTTSFSWQDLHNELETTKKMQFWMKRIL